MGKQGLLEIWTSKAKILSEEVDPQTKDTILRAEVKWQQAGIINNNGRRYSRKILEREIKRLEPALKEGSVYGASYHPQGGDAQVDDISHLWESVRMEKDGSCLGVIQVLPTERGKNAQVLLKAGGKIGISSRGYGTVTAKTEEVEGRTVKVDEVNEDYQMVSPGDLVLSASVPGAGVRRMLEAKMKTEDVQAAKDESWTRYQEAILAGQRGKS